MKILGAGLSRTGTLSLATALEQLGFSTIHWVPERLRDVMMGTNDSPDFRRYDDVEAVTDLPAALFYRELLEAYPDAKCILTIRPEDDWLRSMKQHYEVAVPDYLRGNKLMLEEARRTQEFAYGSAQVVPWLYLKKFRDHNWAVQQAVPPERLLVVELGKNMNWASLCGFLGVPEPNTPFPRTNQSHGGGGQGAGEPLHRRLLRRAGLG